MYIQELYEKISKTNINGKGSRGRCHSLICGEIKLALTLRMLAGSSYLDIMLQHDITHPHIYRIFHHVTKYWICNDKVTQINLYNDLQDEEEMKKTSRDFANGSSAGFFKGCIGAIDGWLIRIKCPSIIADGIKNPGTFYSRKGF